MTLLLKQLFAFLKLLNSDKGEGEIAAGIACGFILGLAPGFSLQTFIVFIILFTCRIQIGATFCGMFFFSIIAWFFDPLFHILGKFILEINFLKGLFTYFYNLPLIPYTHFNNSVVMGALIVSISLSPLVFIYSKRIIVKYRKEVFEKIKQTKLFKVFKATAFYKWYAKYDALYN